MVNGVRCKLPGSNGVIYPWSPPRVGVDLKVLLELENDFWTDLHTRILEIRYSARNF